MPTSQLFTLVDFHRFFANPPPESRASRSSFYVTQEKSSYDRLDFLENGERERQAVRVCTDKRS